MTFTRTASGLGALHHFYRCDIVVFCEGGASLKLHEIVLGQGTDGTLDALFWKNIISYLNLQEKCHVKSVGSRPALEEILELVNSRQIKTITVCIDADYGGVLGRIPSSSRLMRTKGYSWENDAARWSIVREVIRSLVITPESFEAAEKLLQKNIDLFSRDLSRWVEIDIALVARRHRGIFDRSKPGFGLSAAEESKPVLDHQVLKGRLMKNGWRRSPRKPVRIDHSEALTLGFGKVVGRFMYKCLVWVLNEHCGKVKVSYELFMRMLISKMVERMTFNVEGGLITHYKSQKAALVAG